VILVLLVVVPSVHAQDFSAPRYGGFEGAGGRSGGPFFAYDPHEAANQLEFFFQPPARKMFHDAGDNVYLFPPMFPAGTYFAVLPSVPAFIATASAASFQAYRVGDHYVLADRKYEIFSAHRVGDRIFFLARDDSGAFVRLTEHHLRIFDGAGNEIASAIEDDPDKNISLLVDRSGSMDGFDQDVTTAIRNFSSLKVVSAKCGIYEFGSEVSQLPGAFQTTCDDALARYTMSPAEGGTALYTAMDRAYRGMLNLDGLSVIVILSDGRPGDGPTPELLEYSKKFPTFVLWVGDHTQDYIAAYSTAHAVSTSASVQEIEDFFNSVAFSLHGHQAIRIAP